MSENESKTISKEGVLMAQATFSIRMDKKLKQECDILCSDFGMNATTAFNSYVHITLICRMPTFLILPVLFDPFRSC